METVFFCKSKKIFFPAYLMFCFTKHNYFYFIIFIQIIIQIIFILLCIALTVLVLMQEGKSAGLGAISGMAETYWGKNKGRSMEGNLVKITKYLAIGFMLISIVLNLSVF